MSVLNDYLDNIARPHKRELEKIRKIIKQVAPEAGKLISYGIPAFKYMNKYLIYFAAFKNHMSIFPASDSMIEAIGSFEHQKERCNSR